MNLQQMLQSIIVPVIPALFLLETSLVLSKLVDDEAVTCYVAGYIGRCISRRKCNSCKDLLIETDNINDDLDARNALVLLADGGSLSTSKQYYFAVCALGVQVYSKLLNDEYV